MPLKVEFNTNQFRTEIRQFTEDVEDAIIEAIKDAGERFVTDARNMVKSQGGFGDRTTNLRSSIGYSILKDGKIIFGDFKGKKAEGVAAAKRAVEEVPKVKGFQLIGVAGMEYASIVEGKGMNVISIQAEALLVDLKDYMDIIEKRFNKK
ncbi:MAG: hypothetical protein Q8N05_05425 [Bacteroidota bacterium]|nr:hypothetical protein [Bacteroidota bacterium]